ncbi:MAG TPA: hypothetical protein VH374_15395 [Polyangia bacterium]|jgi:dienelactone hydrolase|nr:hypothetical protein [Polyangia bacterium]
MLATTMAPTLATTMGCAGDVGDPSEVTGRGRQGTIAVHVDPRAWDGSWFLNAGGHRLTATFDADGDQARSGTILDETDQGAAASIEATPRLLDQLHFDPAAQLLTFRDRTDSGFLHYRVYLRDSIAIGRLARSPSETPPADPLAYQTQLTGWREQTFNAHIVPRVFDIVIAGHQHAVVRIDRASAGAGFIGRFKVHLTNDILDEQLSEDIAVQHWDGQTLHFTRPASVEQDQFTGLVVGRHIAGTVTNRTGDTRSWTGQQAEVLSHGLVPRPLPTAQDWQARTRRRLGWLAMAGNPAPLSATATVTGRFLPVPTTAVSDHRDDSAAAWPQKYELTELGLDLTLPSPGGGPPLGRHIHAIMAVPTTPPPVTGFPVAVVANGHWGGAWRTFDPQNTIYWYGDSFARRGYVVLSVDISHRPLGDRQALYTDLLDGDDPANGNDSHPAIKDDGLDSEWEEDGERTWDMMRGLDYVLGRADVDRGQVTVVGLSMGGEIAEWEGAMDPRVGVVVAAGASPDLAVMQYHGNHPCYRWQRGDIREYLDPSDLDALIASRTLVRETGLVDAVYSDLTAHFASAKQVVRRAAPAFAALGGHLIHYLHFDAHAFHIGEPLPAATTARGVTMPVETDVVSAEPWSTDWQTNQITRAISDSLFDAIPVRVR